MCNAFSGSNQVLLEVVKSHREEVLSPCNSVAKNQLPDEQRVINKYQAAWEAMRRADVVDMRNIRYLIRLVALSSDGLISLNSQGPNAKHLWRGVWEGSIYRDNNISSVGTRSMSSTSKQDKHQQENLTLPMRIRG